MRDGDGERGGAYAAWQRPRPSVSWEEQTQLTALPSMPQIFATKAVSISKLLF